MYFTGAIFGLVSLFVTVWILDNKLKLDKIPVLNRGLLQIIKRKKKG